MNNFIIQLIALPKCTVPALGDLHYYVSGSCADPSGRA
jgi:hypothetical protein